MYYKRLTDLYNTMDLRNLFPEITLDSFDDYLRSQVSDGNRYISPYKFAYKHNVTINSSVKFFLYYTGNTGIFDLIYYFECSRPSCIDTRIYFDLNHTDNVLTCEECGRVYNIRSIERYVKVLFKLKSIITLPIPMISEIRSDPNSTFDALMELPPHLKIISPSSPEIGVSLDEGEDIEIDEGINIEILFNENTGISGDYISAAVQDFKSKLLSLED